MNEDKYIRGFHWSSKAYYAEAAKTKGEINFGIYSTGGGTTGEMRMRWHDIHGHFIKVPRLECFEDAWKSLASFKDLIDALGLVDGKCITEEEFVKILLGCGFTDLTAYTPKERE